MALTQLPGTMLSTVNTLTSASATNLTLQAAGNTAITILPSGFIGIGTISPSETVHVSTAGDTVIRLASTASSGKSYNITSGGNGNYSPGVFAIRDVGAAITPFAIYNGLVGINTTGPNQQLEVSGSTQSGIIYTRISNTYGSLTSNGAGTALQFYGWDAGVTANIKSLRTGQPYSPSALTFETFGGQSTNNTNTLAERMRVDDYGNLCVGVTSYTGAISNTQVVSAGNFSTYKVSFGALAANTATTVTGITLGSYLVIITSIGTYHSRDTYILHVYDTADVGYANLLHTSYQVTTTFSITSSSYNNYTLSVSFSNPVSGGSWNFIRIS